MDLYYSQSPYQHLVVNYLSQLRCKDCVIVSSLLGKDEINKYYANNEYVKNIYYIDWLKNEKNPLIIYKRISNILGGGWKNKIDTFYTTIIENGYNRHSRSILNIISPKKIVVYEEGTTVLALNAIKQSTVTRIIRNFVIFLFNTFISFLFLDNRQFFVFFSPFSPIDSYILLNKYLLNFSPNNVIDLGQSIKNNQELFDSVVDRIESAFEFNKEEKGIIFLSQPLSEDGICTKLEQVTLFERFLNLKKESEVIYIKTHPRESLYKYNSIMDKYNLSLLDGEWQPHTPREVSYFHYKPHTLISFFSTTIFNINTPYTDKIYLLLNHPKLLQEKERISSLINLDDRITIV